ncbi:bacteriocin-like WGxF protein [Oceanobacillus sp. J11TS1]|uniref:bacteriocin-like WGxF protein n=1 Tax=Oceanobacillus sp. J11TS1 TaxID=2807191 RepID=UPI001B222151|nr:hypothetical protein J11TS1_36270 [Oceanobacillus sp. J11TS1]
MRAISNTILNCFILTISIVVHRLIIRFFDLPINNSLIYWVSFVVIFGVFNLFIALIITPIRK